MSEFFRIEQHSLPPIQHKQIRLFPFARSVSLRLPGGIGGFVWSKPSSLLVVYPDGREEVLPIPDLTYRFILMTVISGLIFGVVLGWLRYKIVSSQRVSKVWRIINRWTWYFHIQYPHLSAFIWGKIKTGGFSMSDNPEIVPAETDATAESSIQVIQDTLDYFLSSASAEAVYHEPIKHGNTLIIPTAEIVSVMGFGLGSGMSSGMPNESAETGKEANASGSGAGGGGGGSVFSRPVAVIVSSPEGVRVDPVFDLTKIALAGMTTGVLMFGMIARLWSLSKKIQDVQDEFLKIK
jgi:uncharacterized spore protein YtfJ